MLSWDGWNLNFLVDILKTRYEKVTFVKLSKFYIFNFCPIGKLNV